MQKENKLEFDDYIITYDQNNYSFNSCDAKFEYNEERALL